MPFVVRRLPCFDKQLDRCLKRHGKSRPHVEAIIDNLAANMDQGDVYPGFNPLSVRKLRIGLPQYRIGKRRGLRLVFMVVPSRENIIPLVIYLKKAFREDEVRKRILSALKQIEKEF